MSCPGRDKLGHLLEEDLDPEESRTLWDHIKRCTCCQEILDKIESFWGIGDLSPLESNTCVLSMPRASVYGPAITGYELLDDLGQCGGMGVVFRARDPGLGRVVAIKVLRAELDDPKARERFCREAQAAARVKHDNLVLVHRVVNDASALPYMVMEYLNGPTLAQLIRFEGFLPPAKVAELIAQVADGLAAAHAEGLIHRDIKPSNIVLDTASNRAKIMDFGLARLQSSPRDTAHDGVSGTPVYMSPEQARGLECIDARSDIYSLGATLYETLTGEPVFRGVSRLVLQQVIHGEPRPPRELNDQIPRDLETVCLKAMAKDPDRRYRTARELAYDLRRWLRGEPINARRVGRIERGWRWCRRRPILALLSGALVLTIAIGVAGVAWQARRAEENAVRAEAKSLEAENQRALAQANYQESEENFREARRFLAELVQLCEGEFRSRSGMQLARKTRLAELLQYHQHQFQKRTDDADLQHDLGHAYLLVGVVRSETDKTDEALRNYHRAATVLDKLCREHPERKESRNVLAAAYFYMGLLHFTIGRLDEALDFQSRAQAIWKELAGEDGDNKHYQRNLALSHWAMANVHLARGLLQDARSQHETSRVIREAAVDKRPDDDNLREHLGYSYHSIGQWHLEAGQPAEALPFFQKASDVRKRLVEHDPRQIWWQYDLARTHLHQGAAYQALGWRQEALSTWNQARSALEQLVRENECVTDFQRHLAEVLLRIGSLRHEKSQYQEALSCLTRARDICVKLLVDNPAVIHSQTILTESYLAIAKVQRVNGQEADGLHSMQEARGIWERLVRDHPDIPRFRSGLARTYLELAALARVTGNKPRKEAFQLCWKASQIQMSLALSRPNFPEFRRNLGRIFKEFALLLWSGNWQVKDREVTATIQQE
jgi:tetratricopeptide (TPR) repeat protein